MHVDELKERIATMSVDELAEMEAFIHRLVIDRNEVDAPEKQEISFEEAARQVRTDYARLLHKLSQ